jgi:membrane-bound ClpP family serine protease
MNGMNSTGLVLGIIGVILVVLGLVQHFAKMSILAGLAHGSLILIVVGAIVFIAGMLVGRSGRRSVV